MEMKVLRPGEAVESAVPPEQAALIRGAYGGELYPDQLVEIFRSGRTFPTRAVRGDAHVQRLVRAETALRKVEIRSAGVVYDLPDYVSRNRVAALLVLKGGRIAFEHYESGNDASTRWLSMSIAKSFSTTLVGAAVQDGLIGSVEDPLVEYLPELAGTAYDGVSIRHVLQMTSGVRWDDTHTDPASERRHMLELQIAQKPGAILRYVGSLPRVADPGTLWNYSTGETHVVGALLRAAVGRWVADYLSEKIWSRIGTEADATWWLESPHGLEVAGAGLSATLRDYARFGLFMLNDGVAGGERVLPEGWVRDATSPREVGGKQLDYGYMWWPVPSAEGSYADGAFSARGIFGQYLYVNPRDQVVIVVWSARSKPKGAEVIVDNDFFNAAVAALR